MMCLFSGLVFAEQPVIEKETRIVLESKPSMTAYVVIQRYTFNNKECIITTQYTISNLEYEVVVISNICE